MVVLLSNKELEHLIHGAINHLTAKYILWKYENYLEGQGKVVTRRLGLKIVSPELEHIAPQTENPETGYDKYDEEFTNQYIDCLGNYLLISKSHNCSIGNRPFLEKRATYTYLAQQREIQELTKDEVIWNKEKIDIRHKKIVDFVIQKL